MSETKREKPLAGSTMTAQASKPSSQSLRDGSEPDDMLLALLWSPTATLIDRGKALLATADYQGQPATIVILVGTAPPKWILDLVGNSKVVGSPAGEVVGSANKDKTE